MTAVTGVARSPPLSSYFHVRGRPNTRRWKTREEGGGRKRRRKTRRYHHLSLFPSDRPGERAASRPCHHHHHHHLLSTLSFIPPGTMPSCLLAFSSLVVRRGRVSWLLWMYHHHSLVLHGGEQSAVFLFFSTEHVWGIDARIPLFFGDERREGGREGSSSSPPSFPHFESDCPN